MRLNDIPQSSDHHTDNRVNAFEKLKDDVPSAVAEASVANSDSAETSDTLVS